MYPFDYLMWAYRAVFKQTDGGGGKILVQITANERMVILHGMTGRNNYAADRTVSNVLKDSDDNIIAHLLFPSPIDDEEIPILTSAEAAVPLNAGTQLEKTLVMGKGDYMQVECATPVLNEELTLAIRALFRSWPPTVTTTGSGGTVTTTTTYDKVI